MERQCARRSCHDSTLVCNTTPTLVHEYLVSLTETNHNRYSDISIPKQQTVGSSLHLPTCLIVFVQYETSDRQGLVPIRQPETSPKTGRTRQDPVRLHFPSNRPTILFPTLRIPVTSYKSQSWSSDRSKPIHDPSWPHCKPPNPLATKQ